MTVKELIEYLKEFPQDLSVAYQIHSEHKLMESDNIKIEKLQPARLDGWIHDVWMGDSKLEEIKYLVFPGN